MTLMPKAMIAAIAALSAACWVEPDDPPPPRRVSATSGPSASTGGTTLPASTPLLVKVDTGRTLGAEPGQGVGVFVEYAAGGKWHVWWTCDTVKTNASCDFDLHIASESGDIATIQSEGVLAGDSVASSDPRTIEARSTTGANAVGVRFVAPAGGTISIDAAVGGAHDPSFFFFVQDDKPNGGFAGPLTDPLRFVGSTP